MKRPKRAWIKGVLIMLLLSLSVGCSPILSSHIVKLEDSNFLGKIDQEAITTFEEGEPISRPYQVLGRVYVNRMVNRVTGKDGVRKNLLIETLKNQAARMGADAIIKVHYSHAFAVYADPDLADESPFHAWASGLAIRFLEDKSQSQEAKNNVPFGVTILPIVNNTKGKTEVSTFNELGQKIAQYYLEQKGYYTVLLNTDKVITMNDIKDSDILKRSLGEDTPFVFLLTVGDPETIDILLMKSVGVGIHAALVSKETKTIIWEQFSGGGAATGLLWRAFIDENKNAFKIALKRLESLPKYEGLIETKD